MSSNSTKRETRKIVITVIAIVLIIIAVRSCFYFQFDHMGTSRASRSFNTSQEGFRLVANYLFDLNLDHGWVRIDDSNDAVFLVRVGERIPISDENVVEAILHLNQRGYGTISMGDEGVRFLLWVRAIEQGHGIAYLPNGRLNDGTGLLPFVIELEPITEDGWYYYWDWFSRWRGRRGGIE